jgi:hypothetical protein
MASGRTGNGAPATTPAHAAFELEQFCWTAPDRLDVTGSFVGLGPAATGAPVLVIEGPDGVRRLPALDDGASPPPEEGRPWSAAFAWLDRPVAFDRARLELGEVHLDLPAPDAEAAGRRLDVHVPATSAPPDAGGAEALRLTTDLLEAREESRELRIAIEHMSQELARTREALQEEQQRRAGDAQRFSEGLAQVRTAAEEALAAKDRELAEARAGLEAAAAGRAEAERLRARLTELEGVAQETEALRSELRSARQRSEAADGEIRALGATLDAARTDAERLLGRLSATRDVSGAEP